MSDFAHYEERHFGLLQVRGFSPRTLEIYGHYLKRFFRYLEDVGVNQVVDVRPDHVRDYLMQAVERATEKGNPFLASVQMNHLSAVKSFFRLLQAEGFLVADPARHVPYPKRPQRLPRSILTANEMKKLLETPDTGTAIGYRDRAMMEVFYSTALRVSELENLKIEEVDLRDGFVRVNGGKGDKDRMVPLWSVACRYVESYLKGVRPMLMRGQPHSFLFVSQYGNKMSKGLARRQIKEYTAKAGLTKNVSPHTFRHTCATLMMKNRANLRHLQEMLGHSKLETTQVYASVSITDLKEAHRKYHPRERERGTI